MNVTVNVLVILACLGLSAFFSGSETALLRLRGHDLERDLQAASGPAVFAARDLLRSTSRLLVTILLGNNVVNTLGAVLASALAVALLGERAGVAVATVTMTTLTWIFAEVLPKAFAARYPRRFSYAVALPLYLLHQLLRPVHLLFDGLIDPLVRRISGGAEGELLTSSEDILRLALRARAEQPAGSPLTIIAAAARAADMTVAEIMVPRAEIVAFPVDTPPADLLERVLAERYTRVPIYSGSIDDVVGVVHLKDLTQHVRHGGRELGEILKPVMRIPERKPILPLLADMQRAFVHLAIVKDEFGVTLGLVTQEDILEEIVGEIRDEFDRDELLTIRRLADGSFQTLGGVKVLDFNRETGWEVPAEPGDTLGGLVFNRLGRSPRKGDVVNVLGYEMRVIDVSGSRVSEVRVARSAPGEKAREG
jgi:magnesium and cobalt exporter, CNNM family